MYIGKCPKCGKAPTYVELEPVEIKQGLRQSWKGVQYLCPYGDCLAILGVQMDPLALANDYAKVIAERLGRG
jgi:hypothetical protein